MDSSEHVSMRKHLRGVTIRYSRSRFSSSQSNSFSNHETGWKVLYEEGGGENVHPGGSDPTHFIAAHGVYFMNMLGPRACVEKPCVNQGGDGGGCGACIEQCEQLTSCPCESTDPKDLGRQGP